MENAMFILKTSLRVLILLSLLLTISCGWGKKEKDITQRSPEEIYQMANQQLKAGKYKEAIESYQTLLNLYPASDLHIDARLQMAEAYGELDEFEEQMDLLLNLLKENIIPGRVPEIYIQIGRFYERAAEFNPNTVTSDTVDYKKAIDYYKQAINYKDSDDKAAKAEALFRRALVEAKIGRIEKAIAHYQMLTERYPQETHALLAQIKLMNPEDTSEPKTDADSLEQYRSRLDEAGKQIPGQDTTVPDEKEDTETEESFPVLEPATDDTSGNE